MRRAIPLVLLLLLSACASPRASCLANATRDVAVLDSLIAQIEGNLARGYAIRQEPYVTSGLDLCIGNAGPWGWGGPGPVGWNYCNQVETRYRAIPVPIDRADQQRKLNELKQTRAAKAREATAAAARCDALYLAN